MTDEVNHPYHYRGDGMEAIDVIEAFALSFHLGNATKYILRAGRKEGSSYHTDLRKAIWYIERAIQRESDFIRETRLAEIEEAEIIQELESRAGRHIESPLGSDLQHLQ